MAMASWLDWPEYLELPNPAKLKVQHLVWTRVSEMQGKRAEAMKLKYPDDDDVASLENLPPGTPVIFQSGRWTV